MGKSGAHTHKGMAGGAKVSKSSIKKMVQNEINKTQEIKVKYTDIDEYITGAPGQNFWDNFTQVSRGNSAEQRLGDKIRPKQLVIEGWFRPLLIPSGADENDAFQKGIFTRLSLLRQQPGVRVNSNTNANPEPVDMNTTRLFLGPKGQVVERQGDYKDIMRPWNYKVVRPHNKGHDKVHYLSMSGASSNTRRFKFVVNFKQDEEIVWTTDGAYPDNGIFLLSMINRNATDDLEIAQTMEIVGESRFYYYDA